MKMPITVIADAIIWLTVMGNLDLAIRHPGNSGPSAVMAREFRDALREKLLDEGVITAEEAALFLRDQQLSQERGASQMRHIDSG